MTNEISTDTMELGGGEIMTALIDWEEVYEDVDRADLAAATTPEAVRELAARLADLAINYLPSNTKYQVDLADIEAGIRASR